MTLYKTSPTIRTWLLLGTVLPALTVAHGGFAMPQRGPIELAQAPAQLDDQPERRGPRGGTERQDQPRGERTPGGARAPDAQRPAGAERPTPPAAPGAVPPTAPRAPSAPQIRRDPPAPRAAPSTAAPEAPASSQPAPRTAPVPPADAAPAVRPTPPRPPATDPAQPRPAPAPDGAPSRTAPPAAAPAAPPATAPAAPAPAAPAQRTTPSAPPAAAPPAAAPPAAAPASGGAAPNAPAQRTAPTTAPPPAAAPTPTPPTGGSAPGIAPQAAPGAPADGAAGRRVAPVAPTAPQAAPPTGAAPQSAPGIAPQAAPQGVAPAPGSAAPGQPPVDRQGRRGGISPGGAAAIGLGAGVVGGIMATQGADRLDDVRSRREERREGDVTIIREPGRTIIRDDDRVIIRRDETQRFRDLGIDQRTERQGGETRTVFERPDGTRVVTITDEDGRLIRRTRQTRGGEEFVIIDNTRRDRPNNRFSEEIVTLESPPLPIPRERYIVDAERADDRLIYETIIAPPIGPIPRRYTLDEVRYSPDLRARMPSVDIDTINFESGSWTVAAGQAQRLQVIAESIRRALQTAPNEVFLVEGHTDAVGPDIDNLSLSDRRAQSVAEILTRDFQVPPENLTTQGYGEQYLKVATQTDSRENRRVTLRRITPLLTGQNR